MSDQDQLLQDVAEALDDACIGGGAGLEDYELQRASEHVADVLFDAGYRKRPSVDTDGLAELIYGVNSGKYGDYCHHEETADAILAAGWRKSRMITTIDELNTLPDESVIRTRRGDILELDEHRTDSWRNGYKPGWDIVAIATEYDLPAIVLWEPR